MSSVQYQRTVHTVHLMEAPSKCVDSADTWH